MTTSTITAAQIGKFAHDPQAFFDSLVIPSAHGPRVFRDIMADFQRERFAGVVPSLLAVAKGEKPPKPRAFWEATKGASKDSDLACCLLWLLSFTRQPLTCQIGAGDRDQAGEMRKAARDILLLNDWLATRVEVNQWRIACGDTNAECDIIAADVTGTHGSRPHVCVVNELSHITREEFAATMADNASKMPNGLMIIATNCGLLGTWQHRWREIARSSPERWFFHKMDKPSPWLDDAEIEEARRRNSTARFNRLWAGEWVSGTGDALDADDVRNAVDSNLGALDCAIPGYQFYAGLDLSVRKDHSALVVLGLEKETRRIRLAKVKSWKPKNGDIDLQAVEDEVFATHKQFKLREVGYDPYQAVHMAQRLGRRGVRMRELQFSPRNCDGMATALLDVFTEHRVDLYPSKGLVDDLLRLTIEEKSYGYKLTSTRDDSGHADKATAFVIALLRVTQAKRIRLMAGAYSRGDT